MDTLIDLLRRSVDRFGDRTALSMRLTLREDRWSYRRLWRAVGSVADYLRHDLGIAPGERVIVWGPNSPQLVTTYFGVMLARLILVPLDPSSTRDFIARVVASTRAAVLIAGFDAAGIDGVRAVRVGELPFDAHRPWGDELPGGSETAEIVFTSGTTGVPKGVVLSHRNIVASTISAAHLIPPSPGYRMLSLLPLSHMLEQTVGLYVPLLFGSCVYYPATRRPRTLLGLLRRYRITGMVLVPQVLELLLTGIEQEAKKRGRLERLQRARTLARRLPMRLRRYLFRDVHAALGGCLNFAISGGAYLRPELAAAWEAMGIRVAQGYGATECAPIIASNSLWRRIPGSVGRAAPGVQVRLSAENEILVKGPNVTRGYWHDEAATVAAFTEDGWYRTGDLAVQDSHGDFYLKGRLKDLIVLPSGLKVHPEDVEAQLRVDPAIDDCVVVGRPDPSGDVHVHAVLVPASQEQEGAAQHELLRRVVHDANARLAPHQRIAGFTVWQGELPRTNLLKVKRFAVLEALAGASASSEVGRPVVSADRRFDPIRHIIAAVAGVEPAQVTPQSDLELDLHCDSLARVELATTIEDELGVFIDDSEMATVKTVAGLLALIERGEAAAAPVTFPVWPLALAARLLRELVQRGLLFPIHAALCRPFNVEGRENLREVSLPALFIANHASHLDAPSVLRALPWRIRRRLAVAAAADYFYGSAWLGLATTLAMNGFPLHRTGPVRPSLEHCGDLADQGWSILLFPEGTRSPTGELQPFKSGSGLLAAELHLPIVPIAVLGTFAAMPKGSNRPRRGRVTVRIGRPLTVCAEDDYGKTTARLEQAVAGLLHIAERGAKPGRTKT